MFAGVCRKLKCDECFLVHPSRGNGLNSCVSLPCLMIIVQFLFRKYLMIAHVFIGFVWFSVFAQVEALNGGMF